MSNLISEYQKIAGEITNRIQNRKYPPESFLPSESSLAREFDVTLSTIRKALNFLDDQGIINSHREKGYQIRSLFSEQDLLDFYSFNRNNEQEKRNIRTKLILLQEIQGLNDIEEFNDFKLWEIIRLKIVDDIPLILETSYIPVKLLPELDLLSLEGKSLYSLLSSNGSKIIRAKEYLEPVNASLQVQKWLNMDSDSQLLQISRYNFDVEKNLVEFRESLFRSDYFSFSVELEL